MIRFPTHRGTYDSEWARGVENALLGNDADLSDVEARTNQALQQSGQALSAYTYKLSTLRQTLLDDKNERVIPPPPPVYTGVTDFFAATRRPAIAGAEYEIVNYTFTLEGAVNDALLICSPFIFYYNAEFYSIITPKIYVNNVNVLATLGREFSTQEIEGDGSSLSTAWRVEMPGFGYRFNGLTDLTVSLRLSLTTNNNFKAGTAGGITNMSMVVVVP